MFLLFFQLYVYEHKKRIKELLWREVHKNFNVRNPEQKLSCVISIKALFCTQDDDKKPTCKPDGHVHT